MTSVVRRGRGTGARQRSVVRAGVLASAVAVGVVGCLTDPTQVRGLGDGGPDASDTGGKSGTVPATGGRASGTGGNHAGTGGTGASGSGGQSGGVSADSGTDSGADSAAACQAGRPCTLGACDVGATACSGNVESCVKASDAEDGTPCGDAGVCASGACGLCVASAPCTPVNACHNGAIDCTTGTPACKDLGTARGNGATCNDGNACTKTDTCLNGTCTGAAPVTCTSTAVCHAAGVCNPSTGVCSSPNAPDTTACGTNKTCTAGTCACKSGTALCSAACVDMNTDARNCGSCGHSCLSGTCGAAKCLPWKVVTSTTTDSGMDVATDGVRIVYTENDTVREVPVAGGTPITLGSTPADWTNPVDVAVSAGVVAWTAWQQPGASNVHTGVFTATAGVANSGANTANSGTQGGPFGGPADLVLSATGGAAYYVDAGLGSLMGCSLSGVLSSCTARAPNVEKNASSAFAIKGGTLFFTDYASRSVEAISTSGGTTTDIATGEAGPVYIALDGAYVYWANAILAPESFNIARNPQASPDPAGASSVLGNTTGSIGGLATDGKYVYYAGRIGGIAAVAYVPVAGGASKPLYSGATGGLATNVLAAGGAVYWYDTGDKTIRGIAAPL